jgi:hypothetical protein
MSTQALSQVRRGLYPRPWFLSNCQLPSWPCAANLAASAAGSLAAGPCAAKWAAISSGKLVLALHVYPGTLTGSYLLYRCDAAVCTPVARAGRGMCSQARSQLSSLHCR